MYIPIDPDTAFQLTVVAIIVISFVWGGIRK